MLANYLRFAVVRGPTSPLQESLKRGFDIAGATAGLTLLSPLIALVSLAVKLESPGPVLCRSKYYDLNDAAFEALEFRCSTSVSGKNISHPAANGNHNITWIGQILRRAGLDKVPQLINVLRGEMSIVGPQPFAIPLGAMYRAKIAPACLHNAKPGVVSRAQVRDGRDDAARIEEDCYYLTNRSLLLDIRILVLSLFSTQT